MRGTGAAQPVPGVPAGEHSGDDGGPGPLAALDLTGGAARERRGPDVLNAQPEHRGEGQVRPGVATWHVVWAKGQIDQPPPAERVQHKAE